MSGFYPTHYLPGVAGAGEDLSPGSQDGQPYLHNPAMPMGSGDATMMNHYESLGYFTGFPDPIMFQPPKPQSSRNRRKSAPGGDHVKHRRTRSGCYTCRSRRVKCDEARPVCERCRKGKRDCVYPDPPASKGSSGSAPSKDDVDSAHKTSPGSSAEDVDEEMDKYSKLDTILDADEPEEEFPQRQSSPRRASTTSAMNLRRPSTRHSSETPSLEGTKSSSSPSVSTGTSGGFMTPFHPLDPSIQPGPTDWSHLAGDLRFYLDYYFEHLTYYNYCMVVDHDDFFRRFLPSIATRSGNEALLYALVGFSAYHYTIQQKPDGQIQDFLQYYNASVRSLLSSFRKKEKQNTATLLTILQLATIEEYLGDWVNLMGHQRAALQILTQLFTPQTAMQSSVTRMILNWYVRFDVFVGMLGGFATRLPREWFSAMVEISETSLSQEPESLGWKLELCSASLRLISVDMAFLYARAGRGEILGEEFAAEHQNLTTQLYEWRNGIDPALSDPTYLVTDFRHKIPLTMDDIVEPYEAGYLYKPPLFSTTVMLCEWHSIFVMHKSQEARILQQEPSSELGELAIRVCQIVETVARWPFSPNGAMIVLQACLGITALFLPQDQKHWMWMRRKFATIEALGYMFPLTMRTRMSELFQDPSCVHWWLPNEEGMTSVVKSIRAFADERISNLFSEQTESVREMATVFAKMRVEPNRPRNESVSSVEIRTSGSHIAKGKGKTVSG
ncbi:hypothetical protein BX600DRAFT_6270 [Xylariales sp. PMI_506]|nr:hypothetical protein BX600DRAFT_6270 [Xylariales sp. PMI_506]